MEENTLAVLMLYQERQILSLVQLGAILDLPPEGLFERVDWLFSHGYLCVEPRYAQMNAEAIVGKPITLDMPLQITIDGQAAIERYDKECKQRKRDLIRYSITTAIAALALILAAISLAAQLGLIQLPATLLPM